jgi:hypothetical protein
MLEGLAHQPVGHVAALRWGNTFSFQTAARPQVLTLRAELCASWDVAEEGETTDLVPEVPAVVRAGGGGKFQCRQFLLKTTDLVSAHNVY